MSKSKVFRVSADEVVDKKFKYYSKVVTMGNIIEVTRSEKDFGCASISKIDKDTYLDLRTGEVKEFKHTENRAENLSVIRCTMARIRALINSNVTTPDNCKWVTLTYAENMTDRERLYHDFEKFWKRFLYWCKKQGYTKPEYIVVVEPQGRGAWHIHAFFIWDSKSPFIPNDEMERLWRQGFTSTKSVKDCDNIGAYFSAYLADIEYNDGDEVAFCDKVVEKTFTDTDGNINTKKFIKGGRLHFYPTGFNIIRHSRGIKEPVVEHLTEDEIKEKVSSAKLTFSSAYEILDVVADDDSRFSLKNTILKQYYNTKRK